MAGTRKFPLFGMLFFVIGLALLSANTGSGVTFMALGVIFTITALTKRKDATKEGDA